MGNPIWRISIDFELLPDENSIDIFEKVEALIEPFIDPHEADEECVRFWSLHGYEVSDEYMDEVDEEDQFGLFEFTPEWTSRN